MDKIVKTWDVIMVNFIGVDHEIKGEHPAIVIQNDLGNRFSPNVTVIPLSSSMTKCITPTHVFIPKGEAGLYKDSIAQCEGSKTVTKKNIVGYFGTLSGKYIEEVAKSYTEANPIIGYVPEEILLKHLRKIRNKYNICI